MTSLTFGVNSFFDSELHQVSTLVLAQISRDTLVIIPGNSDNPKGNLQTHQCPSELDQIFNFPDYLINLVRVCHNDRQVNYHVIKTAMLVSNSKAWQELQSRFICH